MDGSQKNVKNKAIVVFLMMIILGIAAMYMALRFATSEENREKLMWQNRISVVLSGRSEVLSGWVTDQKAILQTLADNSSLRLYFSNISNDMGLGEEGKEALGEYLLPLLNDRALQNGFVVENEDFVVKANVEKLKKAGLALTDLQGQIIIATANMPTTLPAVSAYMQAGANVDTMMIGPYEGEEGLSTVAFITPVFGIDDDQSALGFLIGIKALNQPFFNMLIQPGEVAVTARNYLIQKQNGMINYISNLARADPNFQDPIDASTPSLAANFAYENLGHFATMMNYNGEDVFVSGNSISGTDWVLVRTVSTQEALGPAASRKRSIIIISGLLILSFGIILILIWRHGVSVRLSKAIEKQKELSDKHKKLSDFMRLVTDSQPTEISAVDEKGHYIFANIKAAEAADTLALNMLGKTPSAVLGKARARIDEIQCQYVLAENKAITQIQKSDDEDKNLTIKTDYLPLIATDKTVDRGVLMVKEDISALEQNRLRRELGLQSLVSTLTMIIASRDPYSAAHSQRVAMVGKRLCKELSVDDITASTVELSAAMMNLGKITVPRELLVKPSNLSTDELDVIRASILKSAQMIKHIEFDGPVCETLQQIQAHWDGSGQPKGLAGDQILLSARIVSVANVFVAMISARAHRKGIDMKEATAILLKDADIIYDRRPVVALMNYLENKGGFKEWEDFASLPQDIN